MPENVIFVVSPQLVSASDWNVTLLLCSLDSSRSRLLDGDDSETISFGFLSYDQSDGHHANGFTDDPANALLLSIRSCFYA